MPSNYKRNKNTFIKSGQIFVASLLLAAILSPQTFAVQADTEYIPANKYFETAMTEINDAKSSVLLVMYLVSAVPTQPESGPNQLLSALVKAKDRGVKVKVILDQSINFETENLDDAVARNKNQEAFEFLKKNGVDVFFDESQTYTHTKAIVIDNETVLLGSTNWSKSALTRNNEANLLVHSKDLAQEITVNLNQIKLQENVPAILTPSVPVPAEFLNKRLIGEMASSSDERSFDTYLYFLKEFDQNKEALLTLDYDNLAKSLGIDKMSPEDYRRQITKVLDKLQDKYKLIEFDKPGRNQNTTIKLAKLRVAEGAIELPNTYFKYGWNQTLTFPAKAMLLVNLNYSQNSPDKRFSVSRENLAKEHGLSESFISDGNRELKALDLLDIEYSTLENKNFSERQPNIYTPKDLYDPEEQKNKLKIIESKHGKEKMDRARQAAGLVFEENNLKTITTLIDLENQYGQEIVKLASAKIAEKSIDNPKRSAGYLINTIKSMSKKTPDLNN